jgi:hypothetical protein
MLPFVLNTLKSRWPSDNRFREQLRITPYTFDALVLRIQNDPVFLNNSHCEQIPVPQQLALTLYRLGHDGNGANMRQVSAWSGFGHGTISLVTNRVIEALLRQDLIAESVRWPTDDEKEEASAWVEEHSCKAWRLGQYLVDGTNPNFPWRPYWYGESYYDRKGRYSMNTQVHSFAFNLKTYIF